jgi:hypothetical protein
MAEQTKKTKTKRASKSERTHQRRLKQAGRKPGGAMALQMAKVKAAGEASKKEKEKEKATSSATAPGSLPEGKPNE